MRRSSVKPEQVLAFYRLAEKLKSTLRHSWLSRGNRQESVAEHSWMMGLLAMILAPQVNTELNMQKVYEMIILHDFAEAVTTDTPVWEGVKDKAAKMIAERKAMQSLLSSLNETLSEHLFSIWEEYEQRQSAEAVFVKALDTFDVVAQHNAADISSWDENDFLWQLSPIQDNFFNGDEYLRQLKDTLDTWSITKAKQAGQEKKLDQTELNKRT